MAIISRPKAVISPTPRSIEALINKGGSVVGDGGEQCDRKAKDVPVIVRIPSDLLRRIDSLVAARQLKMPRHTWLLEALLEKASRDESAR